MGDSNIQLSCTLLNPFSELIRVSSESYEMKVHGLKFHSSLNDHAADPTELTIYKGYTLLDQLLQKVFLCVVQTGLQDSQPVCITLNAIPRVSCWPLLYKHMLIAFQLSKHLSWVGRYMCSSALGSLKSSSVGCIITQLQVSDLLYSPYSFWSPAGQALQTGC